MKPIKIKNAYQGNLKNISLSIPKNQLTVVSGVSGSGKSTLLVDVLFMECQRKYLEAMTLQGIAKPHVDEVSNVGAAIVISQDHSAKNPRSTVGTLTNIYTSLRMIFEKLHHRECPNCHQVIDSATCKEELVKNGDDFEVYMYCSQCGYKMRKLTKTEFSFNTKEGACPNCEGLGTVFEIDEKQVIHEDLSLENGAIDFWDGKYQEYQIASLYAAYEHYGLPKPINIPIKDYTEDQKQILCEGVKEGFLGKTLPKTVASGKFEGVFRTLKRRYEEKSGESSYLKKYFSMQSCPVCHGERLNRESAKITVNDTTLPQLNLMSLEDLYAWICELEESLSKEKYTLVKDYILDIKTKCARFIKVGLGYLFLDRQMLSLSGGELQRLKLAALLESDLVGMIYILDEPTCGLHPKDTQGLIDILCHLRDLGNTVIVIEHDPDVMKAADYLIEIGPKAGKNGGEVVVCGKIENFLNHPQSLTGQYLKQPLQIKNKARNFNDFICLNHASKYNLKDLNVKFPYQALSVVTGPSGSGKSTLVLEELASTLKDAVIVEQSPLTRQKRSNVATYCGLYTEIRKLFSQLPEAKEAGFNSKTFSFNSVGGRCEHCEGLGVVSNHLLFFENNEVTCPVCHGKRFKDDVLQIKWHDLSIHDVLSLSIEEALNVFKDYSKIYQPLHLLSEVGLDYIELGQVLTTLSSGEGQRLKLARELMENKKEKQIYLLDEPTRGLHPHDIDRFMNLLNHMVDRGHTVIVVEHNLQMISQVDWVIDLGPEGGSKGGYLMYQGTLSGFIENGNSMTAYYLKGAM